MDIKCIRKTGCEDRTFELLTQHENQEYQIITGAYRNANFKSTSETKETHLILNPSRKVKFLKYFCINVLINMVLIYCQFIFIFKIL